MSKPILLRTDAELQMGDSLRADFDQLVEIRTAEDDQETTIVRHAPAADLIFTCYAPITKRVIDAAPKLRGIVKYGVGVDSIDLDAATARGIPVVHCPDYGTETVADHAFALLIALARRLAAIDRAMQQHGWLWPEPAYMATDLHEKTLGLIGFGRIGKAMARRGTGFGMRLLAYDPYVEQDANLLPGLEFASLDDVISQADFLSLHCVLTSETRGIIGRAELCRMKNSAFLIDVSRGALVDEEALADAVRTRQIAGAGFDVFPREPLTREHPLFGLDNVILTPHFAFYSREAYQRLEKECLDAVRFLLAGQMPKNVRNVAVLAK